MKRSDLYWLAGLLEGEGYFSMVNCWVGGKCYRYPRVGVCMTDADIVARVAGMFDVKMFSYQPSLPSRKKAYRAVVVGGRAFWWMAKLLPLLGIRRRIQIWKVLDEWKDRIPTDVSRRKSCQVMARKRKRNDKGQFILRAE